MNNFQTQILQIFKVSSPLQSKSFLVKKYIYNLCIFFQNENAGKKIQHLML